MRKVMILVIEIVMIIVAVLISGSMIKVMLVVTIINEK
jgi:hypothetical protein